MWVCSRSLGLHGLEVVVVHRAAIGRPEDVLRFHDGPSGLIGEVVIEVGRGLEGDEATGSRDTLRWYSLIPPAISITARV
jgi:hypothetical protein